MERGTFLAMRIGVTMSCVLTALGEKTVQRTESISVNRPSSVEPRGGCADKCEWSGGEGGEHLGRAKCFRN